MKITFLGTGAIGYPLAFCNCDNCNSARKHKGKSIRKRSSILINNDLIIDLGPDTQNAMISYDKNMSDVKYLLQTHIHTDHFDEELLCARIPYKILKKQKLLEIYAHPKCLQVMSDRINHFEDADLFSKEGTNKLNVKINAINSGNKVKIGNYNIKAIETNHDLENGSLLYVIEEKGKNIFYATDTPELTNNAINQLKKIKLNCIIMDHTQGNVDYSLSHLNTKLFIEQLNKLRKENIIDDETIIYGTHISHDGNPYHELAEEEAIKNGYHIAYDGLEIEL